MTDNEIVRSYLEAKDKDKQIVAVLRKGGALGPIRNNGAVRRKAS